MIDFRVQIRGIINKEFLIFKKSFTGFLLQIIVTIIIAATFFYIQQLFKGSSIVSTTGKQGSYFYFAFVGIIIHSYFVMAVMDMTSKIREERLTGTLEAIFLATPVTHLIFIFGILIWQLFVMLVSVPLYGFLGKILFGFSINNLSGIWVFLIALVMAMVSFLCIGIIFATVALFFEKTEGLARLFVLVASFLSGVLFQVALLPPWLQKISYFIPSTWIINIGRGLLLEGLSFTELINDFLILFLFCIILFFLTIMIFNLAVKSLIAKGALTNY